MQLDGIELDVLSEYERNRVERMTPNGRARYKEYKRVNTLQLLLESQVASGELSRREFRERFENEVVAVRRRLHEEHLEENPWTPPPVVAIPRTHAVYEPVNWLREGF